MPAKLDWNSPRVPLYIDVEEVADTTYSVFDSFAPKVSGNMESHTDYEVHNDHAYFWNDCIYSAYQNYLVGKDGHIGAYNGWWDELPATWNRVYEVYASAAKDNELPKWIVDIVNREID